MCFYLSLCILNAYRPGARLVERIQPTTASKKEKDFGDEAGGEGRGQSREEGRELRSVKQRYFEDLRLGDVGDGGEGGCVFVFVSCLTLLSSIITFILLFRSNFEPRDERCVCSYFYAPCFVSVFILIFLSYRNHLSRLRFAVRLF